MWDPDNYSGFSPTDFVAKVFTRLLSDRIQQFLDSKLINVEKQAGFEPKHSMYGPCVHSIQHHQLVHYKRQKMFVTFVD